MPFSYNSSRITSPCKRKKLRALFFFGVFGTFIHDNILSDSYVKRATKSGFANKYAQKTFSKPVNDLQINKVRSRIEPSDIAGTTNCRPRQFTTI